MLLGRCDGSWKRNSLFDRLVLIVEVDSCLCTFQNVSNFNFDYYINEVSLGLLKKFIE